MTLGPPVPATGAGFGIAVALEGDRLAIMQGSGIHVFEREGATWSPVAVLPPPRGATFKNMSLSLAGDTLAAGGLEPGSYGPYTQHGLVAIYRLVSGRWALVGTARPPVTPGLAPTSFGEAVPVDGHDVFAGLSSADVAGVQYAGEVIAHRLLMR